MIKAPFKPLRYFCAPPKFFVVVKGDNALQNEGYDKFWENPAGNRERLYRAWEKVAGELTRLGHELLIPELDPFAPDQVYCADSVMHFIDKWGRPSVLLSNMNSPDRQREVAAAERFFRKLGYTVYSSDQFYRHEGTGDSLLAGCVALIKEKIRVIFMGYGPRSNPAAGQRLADVTGATVFTIPLTSDFVEDNYDGDAGGLRSRDIDGFHLDVLAQPLPTGHVICYWDGLPRFSQMLLDIFYGFVFDEKTNEFNSRLIKISKDDYEKFATNCLAVPDKDAPNGYTLFVPEDISQKLKDTLSGIGYRLFDVDIEVARWSGGGLHCMFNVEYDFSSPTSRKLNYVEEFIIKEWYAMPYAIGREGGMRKAIPGLDVYRPNPRTEGTAGPGLAPRLA